MIKPDTDEFVATLEAYMLFSEFEKQTACKYDFTSYMFGACDKCDDVQCLNSTICIFHNKSNSLKKMIRLLWPKEWFDCACCGKKSKRYYSKYPFPELSIEKDDAFKCELCGHIVCRDCQKDCWACNRTICHHCFAKAESFGGGMNVSLKSNFVPGNFCPECAQKKDRIIQDIEAGFYM